jgi:hypothetical protein
MSDLRPIAEIVRLHAQVRLVPIAEIPSTLDLPHERPATPS